MTLYYPTRTLRYRRRMQSVVVEPRRRSCRSKSRKAFVDVVPFSVAVELTHRDSLLAYDKAPTDWFSSKLHDNKADDHVFGRFLYEILDLAERKYGEGDHNRRS